MSDLTRQQEAEFNKLMQALSSFGQAMGANARHADRSFAPVREKAGDNRKAETEKKTQAANIAALKNINKSLKESGKSLDMLSDEASSSASGFHSLYKDTINASKSLSRLEDESYESADQLSGLTTTDVQRALKRLNKDLGKSGSSLADYQRQQSLLLTAMQKEAETKLRGRDRQEDYYEYVDKMRDKAKDFISRLDATSQISIDGAGDINKVIAKVGQVRANIEQTFDGVDLSKFGGDINELLDKVAGNVDKVSGNDKVISAQQNAAIIAAGNVTKQSGGQISDKALEDAYAGDIRALAKELAALNKVAASTHKAFEQELKARKAFVRELQDDLSGKLKDKLTTMASTAGKIAALGNAVQKANRVFEEMVAFNIAQVPRSFLDVQATSIKFGVSFEEMTKIMQETKPLMAAQGPAYEKNLAGLSDVYRQYGYNSKQMLNLVAPLSDLAVVSGVNVRSGAEMNAMAEKTNKSFNKLSAIVNITQEDFIRFNEKILSSDDYTSALVGLNREEGAKFADSVKEQASNQTRVLGSIEKAATVMAAVQATAKTPAIERLKESINIKRMGAKAGMDPEKTNRLAELYIKSAAARTAAETDEFIKLGQDLGVKQVQQQQAAGRAGLPSEIIQNTFDTANPLSQEMNAITSSGKDKYLLEQAGRTISPAEQEALAARSKGNATVATTSEAKNMVGSLISNSLTVATVAAGGALLSLTGFASTAAKSLAGLTAASGAAAAATAGGGILGKAGGLLGKLGGIGGILGKVGIAGGAVGVVNSAMTDKNSYGWGDMLGSIASGAMVGSVGGVPGAIAGGVAGLGIGAYKMLSADSPAKPAKPADAAPPQTDINTKEAASVNISKFDQDIKTSMQDIALNTFNTVQILNQMLEMSKTGSTSSSFQIPTVRQATTGK